MQVQCPRCRSHVEAAAGADSTCPECGFVLRPPRAAASHGDFQPVGPEEAARYSSPPRRARPPPRLTRERIAFGLALNVFLPGAGTLYTGRRGEGWGQLLLFLAGLATIPLLLGLALAPAAWVWALVSSIQHLMEFDRSPRKARG